MNRTKKYKSARTTKYMAHANFLYMFETFPWTFLELFGTNFPEIAKIFPPTTFSHVPLPFGLAGVLCLTAFSSAERTKVLSSHFDRIPNELGLRCTTYRGQCRLTAKASSLPRPIGTTVLSLEVVKWKQEYQWSIVPVHPENFLQSLLTTLRACKNHIKWWQERQILRFRRRSYFGRHQFPLGVLFIDLRVQFHGLVVKHYAGILSNLRVSFGIKMYCRWCTQNMWYILLPWFPDYLFHEANVRGRATLTNERKELFHLFIETWKICSKLHALHDLKEKLIKLWRLLIILTFDAVVVEDILKMKDIYWRNILDEEKKKERKRNKSSKYTMGKRRTTWSEKEPQTQVHILM